MAFLADIAMIVIGIVYLILNQNLFEWRWVVSEKYPWMYSEFRSFKADLRGMWEFTVSVVLSCALYAGFILALVWPLSIGHEFIQIGVVIPCILHWGYTFTFIATYPRSHQFIRWVSKKVFKT